MDVKSALIFLVMGVMRSILADFFRRKHTPLLERIRRRRWRDTEEEKAALGNKEPKRKDSWLGRVNF